MRIMEKQKSLKPTLNFEMPVKAPMVVNAMIEDARDLIERSREELFMFLVDHIGGCGITSRGNR